MMSAFEDGQQQQQEQQQQIHTPQPLTPLRLTNEAANNSNNSSSSSNSSSSISNKNSKNNNSIMGKVKFRVSSIISDSVYKWFTPAASASMVGGHTTLPSSSSSSSLQHNGSTLLLQGKHKRGSRRIQLEADDAPDLAVDDGTDAQDLNDEEVQLADNIAEHDLAGEDEQTRRSEYNVSLLRKRQLAVRDDDDDDDDEDAEAEEEDDDEPDDGTQQQQQQPLNYNSQLSTRSVNFRSSTAQPLPKRKRLEPTESPFSPQFSAQRRRPQLHASTPAASDALRSHAPPNRFSTHLKLYRNQSHREPAYNFMSAGGGGSSNEADVATSGDLPMSSRRSLNIAPMTERRDMALPSYKRKSLTIDRRLMPNWRSYQTISEVPNEEHHHHQQQQQQTTTGATTIIRQETNNNNTIIQTKRSGTDSHSECESNESHAAAAGSAPGTLGVYGFGRLGNNNNNNNIISNSNSLFYGNLQSRKSVFNTTMPHYNSTLSLNSLNHRRRFNASIYGSTSALSDSRLLSSSVSAAMSGSSPFYQGPTAFGGSSANNRYFSQGNLAINSGGSSPAPSNSDSVCSGNAVRQCNNTYGIKPVDMRPRVYVSGSNADACVSNMPGLSHTAQRILNLLENHTTPLMDAKKMGSTLREHQQQRSSRHAAKPYSYPTNPYGHNNNNTIINTSNSKSSVGATESDNNSNLLVPTMLQLLERRRLHRVAPSTRALIDAKQKEEQQLLQQHHQQAANTAATVSPSSTSCTAVATTSASSISISAANATNCASAFASATAMGSQSHTNKMRSRLSHHHPRKDMRAQDENDLAPAPLDLPNIRFPLMASEPKFDLIIAPPKATATGAMPITFSSATSPTTAPAPAQQLAKFKDSSRTCYKFATPMPINCASVAGEATCSKQKRVKHNFTFAPPTHLDELPKRLPSSTQFNGSSMKMSTALPVCKSPSAAEHAVLPVAGGFGDQFKKSSGEWECEACMVRNKLELSKCVACETPKPKAKGATSAAAVSAPTSLPFNYPTVGGFGDRFKQPTNSWECDACMLSNKSEHNKCVACETPRKQSAGHGTQVSMPTSGGGSSSNNSSSFGGSSNSNSFPSGFGDAFKPKANTWECGSCMLFNQASCNECVACQAPNPKGTTSNNNNSSNSSSSNNNFKFGFAAAGAGATEKPKADAGFQQLIAAQKSSSWNCEACMAQNDINRNKCICCEQLKPGASAEALSTSAVPKFMFGFAANPATTAAAATTTTAATISFAAPAATTFAPAKQFQFGFAPAAAAAAAPSQDAADGNKPLKPLTAQRLPGFGELAKTAGDAPSVKPAEKAVNFKFGSSETQQQQLSLKPAKAADMTAPAGSKAPATSSIGSLGMFTPAPATTTTTMTIPTPKAIITPATTLAFGSKAGAAPAESKLFSFGNLTPNIAVSSSTSSTSNSGSSTAINFKSPSTTNMFKFGGSSNVSSTTSSGSLAATGTATTSLIFGQTTPIVTPATVAPIASFAAATATTTAAASAISFAPPTLSFAQTASFTSASTFGSATATFAPAATAAVTAPTFVFGNQPNVSAAAAPPAIVKPTAAPAAVVVSSSTNFFFGASASTASTTTTAASAAAANTSNAGANANIFGSITTAKSGNQSRSFSMPPATNNKAPFTFGSSSTTSINKNNTSFGSPAISFGAKPMGAPAVGELAAGISSRGNAAGNSGSSSTSIMGGNTTTALSGFGWPSAATTTAAATPFASTTTTAAAGASPFANNPGTGATAATSLPVFGSAALFGGNTAPAATTNTNAMQPQSSPFGAATSAASGQPLAGGSAGNGPISNVFGNVSNPFGASGASLPMANIFNAAATTTVAATTTPKPAFNFGGPIAASAPQAATGGFNFGAGLSNAAAGSVVPKPAFNFTAAAPQAAAFNFSANSATPGNAGSTDSTPNAAPFQFNAGAPAAPANIFAFNPPANAGNAMQNPRRKIRAPMRRLPPR